MKPSRPSPALVIAIVALIAALTGSAYALKIGTKQLKNKSVSTKKLKNGAVNKVKLKNAAVGGAKLGGIIVRNATVDVTDGDVAGQTAVCNPGEKMIGGGARYVSSGASEDLLLVSSGPRKAVDDNSAPDQGGPLVAWRAAGVNEAGATGTFPLTVFAICLPN
jgi:hypothetical protein